MCVLKPFLEKQARNQQKTMKKFDFIKQGNLLLWNKTGKDCQVVSTPEKVNSDSIILIRIVSASASAETMVLASELSPIPTTASYKKEFLRWKTERESEGMKFFNRLSDVMGTDNDLTVGDMVALTNSYGVVFGPKETLAFGKPSRDGRCVYIDMDAYWFPVPPDRLSRL